MFDLESDLVLEIFGVLHGLFVEYQPVGQGGEDEIQENAKQPVERKVAIVNKKPVSRLSPGSLLTRRSNIATSSVAIYYRGAMRSGKRSLRGPEKTNVLLVCRSMMRRPVLRWSHLRAG